MALQSSPTPPPGTSVFDSIASDDESWAMIESASHPSSVGVLPSPSAHSIGSYAMISFRHDIGHHRGHSATPSCESLSLNSDPMPMPQVPTSSPIHLMAPNIRGSQLATYTSAPTAQAMSKFSLKPCSTPGTTDVPAGWDDPMLRRTSPDPVPDTSQEMFMALFDQGMYQLMPQFQHNANAPSAISASHQQQQRSRSLPRAQAGLVDMFSNIQDSEMTSWNINGSVTDSQEPMFAMDSFTHGGMPSPGSPFGSLSASASTSVSMGNTRSPIRDSPPIVKVEAPPAITMEQQAELQQLLELQQQQQQQQQGMPGGFQDTHLDNFLEQQVQLQMLYTLGGQQQQQRQHEIHQGPRRQQQLDGAQQLRLAEAFPQLPLQTQFPLRQHETQQPTVPPPDTEMSLSAVQASVTARATTWPTAQTIDRVRGSRVHKTRRLTGASAPERFQFSTSSSSDDKFVVFTPKSIKTHTGKGNRFVFEGFDAMSASQKGRKGPLAEEVKESALQVRRAGACFCCHSRKVACSSHLPCRNCQKLNPGVPIELVCWRFESFNAHLFPSFIRKHFNFDEMANFISQNVATFTIDGVERSCNVKLSAGPCFKTNLEIRGVKVFTPLLDAEVTTHTHLTFEKDVIQLEEMKTVPLALDLSENASTAEKERLRKACRTFVDNLMKEDAYVGTITADIRQTDLPRKILGIVRQFYFRTNAPIVKQAFSALTLHYLMTHHLLLTPESKMALESVGCIPHNCRDLTSRLLNRQVKAIMDGMLQDEVDKLFRMFNRELKPKGRTAWATCLAAFLVFCVFMECTSVAFENFVMSTNEADLRRCKILQPENSRKVAILHCRTIENLPFRQFSYQFHHIYQTFQNPPGTKAASTPSSLDSSPPSPDVIQTKASTGGAAAVKTAFNPLMDDKLLNSNDLDKYATELVLSLRKLVEPYSESWQELDFLAFDSRIDDTSAEVHPYPRDMSLNYTGRLCSKFLLSFQGERYIFTPSQTTA